MKKSPDEIYRPQLANLFQEYCNAVRKDCGATSVRVEATFRCRAGSAGVLKTKTFVSPDAKIERMLDPDVPMRRGSLLQFEVSKQLKSQLKQLRRKQ